ncbi:hypothetical protein BB560_004333, partial [Smittium megazygosporum]
ACITVFNFMMLLIFGVFHQSGVLRSIFQLNNDISRTRFTVNTYPESFLIRDSDLILNHYGNISLETKVWFIYTYMPPQFLFYSKKTPAHDNIHLNINTTVGMKKDEVYKILNSSTITSSLDSGDYKNFDIYKQTGPGRFSRTLVVIPANYNESYFSSDNKFDTRFKFTELHSFPLHLDFDDIGYHFSTKFSNMYLKCFQLTWQQNDEK